MKNQRRGLIKKLNRYKRLETPIEEKPKSIKEELENEFSRSN